MWSFSLSRALGLMLRTAPFLALRLAVYLGIGAALILMTGAGAGLGSGVGLAGGDVPRETGALWGGAAGLALTVGAIFFLRDYLLYLVKAGHVAVMVELLEGRTIPGGRGQIAHARGVVAKRFGQASALYALDLLIKGVVGVITGLIEGALSLLPVPGLGRLTGVLRAYLRQAAGLADEVILGHAIRSRSENAWEAAHDGLVLYAMNARPMLVAAAWLTLITWVLAGLIFLVTLGPAAALTPFVPGGGGAGLVAVAALFAWAVKAALIEPFALACLLQVFFRETDGQTPNAEWRGRLAHLSGRFRKLGEEAVARGPVAAPAADPG
jgi:hypothetical protein